MKNIRFIDEAQSKAGLGFRELVDALAAGFPVGCEAPLRHHHVIASPGQPDSTLLLMPAWDSVAGPGRLLGVKLVTVYPGNTAKRLPGLASTYLLFDADTGQEVALIDGNVITARRTAATAALGARFLSRVDAGTLLLFGAGRVASLVPEAMRTVRPIERVMIWDIRRDSAASLAGELKRQGFETSIVDDVQAAVASADIVSAATLATEPLFDGDWVRPGTHVDLIGSFTPKMREADDRLIAKAALYVDTLDALHETGDLIQPIEAGAIDANHIRGTIADLCRGTVVGRSNDRDITLFKAVGSSLADLITARLIYHSLPYETPVVSPTHGLCADRPAIDEVT